MASSLADLRTELRSRLGGRSTTALSDARMDWALRASTIQISSPMVHRHADLESTANVSTVSSTDTYNLGIAVWSIFSGRDTTTSNARRLSNEGPQFMDELQKTSGPPLRFARWGGFENTGIELDPIPDGVYTLVFRVYSYPVFDTNTPMAGNSLLREVYDEGILLGAEYCLWMNALQNPFRGKMVKNQLSDWMDTILSPYIGELDDNTGDILAPDVA